MSRLQPISVDLAKGKTRELLETAQKKSGKLLNIVATMANSPAVLEAYLEFSGKLKKTKLPAKVREAVALAIGEKNRCEYCIAAHTQGGHAAGLTDAETMQARQGEADDPKLGAVLKLALAIVETKGFVSDDQLAAARQAGLSDEEITEVVGLVALNLFTNYFNHVADTEVDFPKVALLKEA